MLPWVLLVALPVVQDVTIFDYDRDAPLDVREVSTETLDGIRLRDITYGSPVKGRVPAYLIEPATAGEHAGILFVHWGQGNRTEFISEALELAGAGAVSLLIDAPHLRPERDGFDGFAEPERERDQYVQLVVDVRRGFDLLDARDDVGDRLGYVGHSLGATWGGVIAGVDARVRALALMGGLPTLGDPAKSFPEALWAQIRAAYTAEQIERYRVVLDVVSPERIVGRAAPGRILFQFAHYDRFISDEAAAAYEKAAREPTVLWYRTSHEFNDGRSYRDRIDWLSEKLRLGP